ncbi:hypothetical protein DSP71_02970 [Microbacterium sp. H6]|nr:hypothetical protein DSP71_02970 [Microbacterium sp. H6]
MAGQRVEALLDDSTGGGDSILLDESGFGVIDLRPTFWQFIDADLTTVTFRYVLASGTGPSAVTTLLDLEPNRPETPGEVVPVESATAEPSTTSDVSASSVPSESAPVATEPEAPASDPTPTPVEAAPAPIEAAPAPVETAPVQTPPAETTPAAAPTEAPVAPAEEAPTGE